MPERKDQPSAVTTQETPRPRDADVVTSDLPTETEPGAADKTAQPAAATASKDDKGAQKPEATAASDNKENPPLGGRRTRNRINRMTKQLSALETTHNADQQEIQDLRQKVEALESASAAVAAPEPELKDYATPQEFAKAYGKWDQDKKPAAKPAIKPAATTRQPAGERDPNANATHESADQRAASDPEVAKFQKDGAARLGDEFTEALEIPGTAVDQDMGEFLIDSEFGAEIYVHLANNQEEAQKIFDSSTRRKNTLMEALEVKAKAGELDVEGQVIVDTGGDKGGGKPAGEKPAASQQRGGKQTKAGDPPSDTRESGTAAALEADPENESMDDYTTRRRREIRKGAGLPV